jgi:hypothetical protein
MRHARLDCVQAQLRVREVPRALGCLGARKLNDAQRLAKRLQPVCVARLVRGVRVRDAFLVGL